MVCTVGESFVLTVLRVRRTKGRRDLAVLVSRLAKTFSLFEPCPIFLSALFPCTGFEFEAAAAEWGL